MQNPFGLGYISLFANTQSVNIIMEEEGLRTLTLSGSRQLVQNHRTLLVKP